ncbi:hypothetical protein D9M68_706660 [compost metagenome]
MGREADQRHVDDAIVVRQFAGKLDQGVLDQLHAVDARTGLRGHAARAVHHQRDVVVRAGRDVRDVAAMIRQDHVVARTAGHRGLAAAAAIVIAVGHQVIGGDDKLVLGRSVLAAVRGAAIVLHLEMEGTVLLVGARRELQ